MKLPHPFLIEIVMFRIVLYLLLAVVLISVLRSVIGVVMKMMASFLNTSSGPNPTPPSADAHQLGGELHRDPVCGTYVAESTPHQRRISGQMFYYCSESCRERHALAPR
jgi:YHS domain-containing protein